MARLGQGARVVADRAFVDEHADELVFYDDLTAGEEDEVEARLRYYHLPPNARAEVDLLLRGQVDCAQLPRLPPRTVRLFVSSTGTDFVHEKEALIKETFHELRAYCRQSYGIDLQVIDPRWGQREHSYAYHCNLDLYRTELSRSALNYYGPHQLVLLGDKLGTAEIPRQIPAPLYSVIVTQIETLEKDTGLLAKWYRENTNASPDGEYVLRPIHEVLGDNWEEREWLEEQRAMRELLVEASELALSRGEIDTEEVQQICGGPVLAQEIQDGLTSFQTKILAVHRRFANMAENCGSSSAHLYTDLITSSTCMDPELANQRQILTQQLKDYLDDDGLLLETTVPWSEPSGMNVGDAAHAGHVRKVCGFVYQKGKQLIDESVAEYKDFISDPLYQENVKHWTRAAELTRSVFGRKRVLSRIEEYISSKTSSPLVISGACGQGKSTVLAVAAQSVLSWLEKEGHSLNVSLVLRFCGHTERSSDVRPLIEDVCQQISYCTGNTIHRLPKQYKNQATYLRDILQGGNFRGLLILFIDGLDNLVPSDAAARLDWLPFSVPNNVKVILSTSTHHNSELLRNLRRRYPRDDAVYTLGPLHVDEATSLFIDRLKQRDRRITGNQLAVILSALHQDVSPLDIEAMSILACQMASYDSGNLPATARACLSHVLDEAEKKHQPVFVAHSLMYLTLADGLSEAELYDVLSLDDEVLQYLSITGSTIQRFPVVYWLRLFNDIRDFFAVRQCDLVDVLYWKHSIFKSVAEERYCTQSTKKVYLFTILADYYRGCGSYVANPTVPRCQSAHRTRVRQLPLQPNVYGDQPATKNNANRARSVYNKRRQHQLPKCLMKSNQKEEFFKEVLFNFQWLHAKLKSQSIYAVLRDYEVYDGCREARLVQESLRMSEVALKEDPDQLSTELLSRLLQFYHKYEHIRKLLYEADLHGSALCAYVPHWQCYHSPGAVLQYCHHIDLNEYNSQSGTSNVKLRTVSLETTDEFYLLCKKASSSKVYTWDILNGFESRSYTAAKGRAIYPSPCGQYINCFTDHGTLQVYDAGSSQMTYDVSFGKYGMQPSHVALSARYTAFMLPGVPGPYIVDITAGTELRRLTYQCGALVFSEDGRLLALHSRACVIVIEMPLMMKKCSADIRAVASKLLFTQDNSRIFALTGQHEVKEIDINYTYKQCTVTGLLCSNVDIHDIVLSNDTNQLLATALYSLVILDVSSKSRVHIKEVPEGRFDDCLKPFTCSGFSADGAYVVATRGRYLCVWDTRGRPVRLLTYASSVISEMFPSKHKNIVLTVHENKAIQMWNLDNLQEETDFNNRTFHGSLKMSANSPLGIRFLCVPSDGSVAMVYNSTTNVVEHRLQHASKAVILSVAISPDDCLGITVSENTDKPDFVDKAWQMVKDTKLWNLELGQCIYGITNNTYTVFSPDACHLVFCPCLEYDLSKPTLKVFNLVVASVAKTEVLTSYVELSEGVLLEEPVFLAGGRYLCYILCDRSYKTHFCLQSLEGKWSGVRYLDVEDMLDSECSSRSELIMLRNIQDDQILVVIGRQIGQLEFNEAGCLDLAKPMPKSAVIYDVHTGTKQVISDFLVPSVRLDLAAYDAGAALFACDCKIWCGKTGQLWKNSSQTPDLSRGRCCFLMGRRYLAVVAPSGTSVILYRTSDMEKQTKIQIHGRVLSLSTANEKTLAVTCIDGRICLFLLTLTECDAMTDVISRLPSRRQTTSPRPSPTSRGVTTSSISPVSWREMMMHKKVNEFRKLTQNDVIGGNGIGAFCS